MKNEAFLKLQAFVATLRNGSRKSLLELYGKRPSKVEEVLRMRNLRERAGQPFWTSDVLTIAKHNKKLFNIDDPKIMDLAKFMIFYEERFVIGKEFLFPTSVVSVDLGPVNSAYCLLDDHYQVKEWSMLDFRLPSPYSPGECYRNVSAALQMLPQADLYLLEEQSHRPGNHKGFLGISVQLRCLEATVYALLSQRRGGRVQSVLPSRVGGYFGISGNTKKTAAVGLVRDLIGQMQTTPLGEVVRVSDGLKEYFQASRKRDDLSDSLLQGLALLEWSRMCHKLTENTQE